MRKVSTLLFLIFMVNINSRVYGQEAWKFIVLCDSRSDSASIQNGVNTAIMSELASEIVSQQADLVLFAGDLVVGGVDQIQLESQFRTWRDTMQPVYEAGIGVYVVRGNHDEGNPAGTTAWNNVFKDETDSGGLDYSLPSNGPAGELNLTYSITHNNAFFLGIDQLKTEYRSKNKVNQAWIDTQLASNVQPHIFAFGHYTSFKMIWDSLGDYPTDRDLFWEGLKDAGGRTYFCGHEHFYNHTQADDDGDPSNDLHQYVIGSAGASIHIWDGTFPGNNGGRTLTNLYHTTKFGYVLVEINGMDVNLTWMERQGENDYQAAEYWSYSVASVLGDFDEDRDVDLEDLRILAEYWLNEECNSSNNWCLGADFDQLNNVNIEDFSSFSSNWLYDKNLSQVKPPILTGSRVEQIGYTEANLESTISWNGGEDPVVTFFWGPVDGITDANDWAYYETIGIKEQGTFLHKIESLDEGILYFFRCYAENSAGGVWTSPSASFRTKQHVLHEHDYREDFEDHPTDGTPLNAHADWYSPGSSMQAEEGIGVNGSVGLVQNVDSFIWEGISFSFSDDIGLDETIVLSMDFETNENAVFDDDRAGWVIQLSGNSDYIFGVQLDPRSGGGVDLEGYWDHIINVDEDKRPLIASVNEGILTAETYYRLYVELTKLTTDSVRIEAGLWSLDEEGNPSNELLHGTIANTSLLGTNSPDPAYFTSPVLWPAFKNYNGSSGHCDNAYFKITDP